MKMDLEVGGMTCQHCVKTVTKALQGIQGVDKVAVDLAAGRACVEGKPDAQALVRALTEQGYEARVLSAA